MKRVKMMLSMLLTFVMVFSMTVPAFATVQDTGFSDVAADVWYAEAVVYSRDNGVMGGTTDTTFEPNTSMSRAMLATVLYRIAESPAVSGTDSFTDTDDNAWYSNAVHWASQQNIIGGYGNDLFGTNDSVSREQIATILWRYEGSPEAGVNTTEFSDMSAISDWAIAAVKWARENGIVDGKGGNRFDPSGNATRAEVATILRNYLTKEIISTPNPDPTTETNKTLIVYFSMPETTNPDNMTTEEANSTVVIDGEVLGNTQYVAQLIQENTGADIFRIEPQTPYPTDHETLVDLAKEEQERSARPELAANVENLDQYDVIFLGYPNWWSDMPMILYSFLESHDLSGKTIVPFNTHGGSGFSSTINTIAQLQPNSIVNRDGFTVYRNSVQDSADDVAAWLKEHDYLKKNNR